MRFATNLEKMLGTPLVEWVDMSEGLLFHVVQVLTARNLAPGTIQSYLSAVGTFAGWLNKPRPASTFIMALLKGQHNEWAKPKEKVRVHHFPIVAALDHIDTTLADRSAWDGMSWLQWAQLVLAMFQLVWPHRPHSVLSVRADTSYMADSTFLFLDPAE